MSNPTTGSIGAPPQPVKRFSTAFGAPPPSGVVVPLPVKGFVQVDRTAIAVMSTYDLSRAAIMVYLILCQYANGRKAHAWPGTATLARETGLSAVSVKRARRDLEAVGLVERSERSHVGTIKYRMPTLATMKGDESNHRSAGKPSYPQPKVGRARMTPGGVTGDPQRRTAPKGKNNEPPRERSTVVESKTAPGRRAGPAKAPPGRGDSAPDPTREVAESLASAKRIGDATPRASGPVVGEGMIGLARAIREGATKAGTDATAAKRPAREARQEQDAVRRRLFARQLAELQEAAGG